MTTHTHTIPTGTALHYTGLRHTIPATEPEPCTWDGRLAPNTDYALVTLMDGAEVAVLKRALVGKSKPDAPPALNRTQQAHVDGARKSYGPREAARLTEHYRAINATEQRGEVSERLLNSLDKGGSFSVAIGWAS